MRTLTALAAAEARMLARNRTAAFNALALPLLFGALWLTTGDATVGPAGPVAALQVIAVLAFTVYCVATTTLVARREQRVLKRWRTSPAATSSILSGTLAPLGALLVLQTGVLLAATGLAHGAGPTRPGLLALAVLAGGVLCAALAFVTAAFTSTVESTMVTVAPVLGALFGGAVWVVATPPAQVSWQMLATGGGAVAHLARLGWDGLAGGTTGLAALAEQAGPSLVVTALLTLAAVAVAARVFRWEPRT